MTDKKKPLPPTLSTKQKKFLKGLAHPLSASIQIGKEGITDNLISAITTELQRHELIKVKIGSNSSVEKGQAADLLPDVTAAALVQVIGKTILLYRPNPKRNKEERIRLPKA